jgi:hypothetical protein
MMMLMMLIEGIDVRCRRNAVLLATVVVWQRCGCGRVKNDCVRCRRVLQHVKFKF